MADSEVRQKFEAWKASLLKCVGNSGGCDGDLEGMEHEPNCPLFGKQFATHFDAFSAGVRAGEIARSEFVIDLLDKRMRKMLEVDAEDGRTGVEIAKAECFHLMEIQRILRGQTTCGVYDDYGKVPAAPEEKK